MKVLSTIIFLLCVSSGLAAGSDGKSNDKDVVDLCDSEDSNESELTISDEDSDDDPRYDPNAQKPFEFFSKTFSKSLENFF